ncbi:orotidine-5'-phosphate decarboxylase [Haloimpatiens sp. FM7315]|uniref:orotidine-5'-phosphate decarboxylase n=1 Tax=Haloimpatiens sp. FM7315 TaxID=3298609 RepID=UPI0035A30A76
MIIDKLYENVKNNGPVCVGLDTSIEYIPKDFLNKYNSIEDAITSFNERLIDATIDNAACFKVQIAYYEALGLLGLRAYKRTLDYIRKKSGIIVADIKRGDISKTAEMYAKAHFEGDFESDFITLNPYMGLDTIGPYLKYVDNSEKGLFILLRTSNEGAKDIQYISAKSDRKIYNIVGEKIQDLGEKHKGKCGYSSIGAVVGCTHGEEAEKIREDLDKTFFLIPGYGAQGGAALDVARYMKNGNGGVVNSSRGILLAYKKQENGEKEFDRWAREEVINMRRTIEKACKSK